MRVSVDHNDPGYRQDAHSGNYECFLDGEKVDAVITADEEQGYILKYELDENKERVLKEDETTGQRYLATEELKGNVKIKRTMYKETYSIAKQMLDPDGNGEGKELHPDLKRRLDEANSLCQNAGGELVSRQAIAIIILDFEKANPAINGLLEE